MKKNLLKMLFLFCFLSVLPGCWNYQEVNQLAIVAGAAVDKGFNHRYLITMEIISFKSGKEPEIEPKRVTGEGNSILEAIRNCYRVSGFMGFWHHTQVFLISQDVAREGILPILDLLIRSPLIRITVYPMISKEATAREVLTAQGPTQPIRSFQIGDALKAQRKSISKAPEVMTYQAINALGGEGSALMLPTVGVVNNEGQPTIEISGAAVFKKDRLIGLLDGEESKYVLLLRNELKGGILLENPREKTGPAIITFKITKNQTGMKPVFKKGKLLMQIQVKTQVDIWEMDTTTDYNSEKGRKILQTLAEKALERNLQRIIHKVQQDFGTDIFGFSKQIRSQMPSKWKKIKPDWERVFRELQVEVKAKIEIQASGVAVKTIQIGG